MWRKEQDVASSRHTQASKTHGTRPCPGHRQASGPSPASTTPPENHPRQRRRAPSDAGSRSADWRGSQYHPAGAWRGSLFPKWKRQQDEKYTSSCALPFCGWPHCSSRTQLHPELRPVASNLRLAVRGRGTSTDGRRAPAPCTRRRLRSTAPAAAWHRSPHR